MKRSALLRFALLSLCSALTVLALIEMHDRHGVRAGVKKKNTLTQGALTAVDATGKVTGPCPLKRTEVKAEISGFISRVTVTQEFENPFEEKIEAVYTFPLPQSAAVDDMTMLVGDRTIKGTIMRREEARKTYEEAKTRGNVASLLDQERPNIFTQSVANIMPGQGVKITISYVETLKYEEGAYEWSFPMVVGERYIPGGRKERSASEPATEVQPVSETATEGEQAPDAARISPPRVPKGMRAGHDISIEVALDAGVPIESVASSTHEVIAERPDGRRAVVRLQNQTVIPNKDFVLKYDVAGRKIEDALLAHHSSRGGFFTLILQPPDRVTFEDVMPKEIVFVLDTSGSMDGFPLDKAKETIKLALKNLYPLDTFNLITFAGDTHVLFPEPVPATPENLRAARKFLSSRKGDGGTEMMQAIRAALDPSDSQGHVRIVCFLTDGQVGNDFDIIAEVQKHPNARVFAMGFSNSPNRFLLDKMAEYGGGEVEYVADGDDGSAAARRFHERVRNPLLTDLSIEWQGLQVADVYPARVPDLFSAKPVILAGRYEGGGRGVVRLKGKMSGREFVREIPVALPEREDGHDALATLWARRRIDEQMGRDMGGLQSGRMRPELRDEITRLGLDFRLMTQFTSFVAVEDQVITGGGDPRRVEVPVEASDDDVMKINTTAHLAGSIMVSNGGAAVMGGVNEMVTVTSSSATVSEAVALHTTVETRSLQDLPLKGRSFQSLVLLSPGTTTSVPAQPDQIAQDSLSSNGQRTRSNMYTVDGVSANFGIAPGGRSPGASAAGTAPGLTATGGLNGLVTSEATREVNIRTYNIEPQYGRVPGAQVAITTRAGTNEFHGTLFGYFGHDATDANDWFANSRALPQPRRRLGDFGGTLGGPLRRDNTFFFAAYEGLRLRQPGVALTDVPTLDARLAAAPALRPFLDAYPLPNGPARADGFAEFASSFANAARLDAFSFRLDQRLGDKVMATARYNFADSEADERGAGGFSLNTLNKIRNRAQTLTGTLSYVVSPTVVTEFHANYSRLTARGAYRLDEFGGAALANGSSLSPDFFSTRDGSFRFDLDGRGAALFNGSDAASTQRQFNFIGSVTVVSGTHTTKLGADYRRMSPVIGLRREEQEVLFDGVSGAIAGVASRVGAYTHTSPQRPVFHNLSLYAQDEWRPTPRLTLTYGLRWEINPAPSNSAGPDALAVTQTDDPSRLSLAPPGAPLWRTTYANFAPRAGLAYQLTDDDRLVLRSGFGLYYDLGHEQAGHAFADSFPFLDGNAVFDIPFPNSLTPPATSGAQVNVPFSAFDPEMKLPYTWQWHLSVERALGNRQTVSAAYVGAAARRLHFTRTLFDVNPDFSFLRLTTDGAKSDYHSMQLQFNRRLSNGLQALVAYTWSKSLDDFSQDTPARVLVRADDTRSERGPSDFDTRHALAGFVSYSLPAPFDTGLGNMLSRNWALDSLFNVRSSRPLNVLYATRTAYGFAYPRPDLAGGVPLYLDDTTAGGGRRLNPAAFVIPADARQGTLGRNSLRGFPLHQVDLALRRQFDFPDRFTLQFRAEALNLFNHPNFEDPAGQDASLGSRLNSSALFRPNMIFGRSYSTHGRNPWGGPGGSFNQFYSAGGARVLQFSVRLNF